MKRITVVWNKHGAGSLIGVFDNDVKVKEIRNKVKSLKEQNYIEFIEVELNKEYFDGLE
jgi:hypothetical protein